MIKAEKRMEHAGHGAIRMTRMRIGHAAESDWHQGDTPADKFGMHTILLK